MTGPEPLQPGNRLFSLTLGKVGLGIVVEVKVGVIDDAMGVVVLPTWIGRVVGLAIIVASILAWIVPSRSGIRSSGGPDSSPLPQLTNNMSAGVSGSSDTDFKFN